MRFLNDLPRAACRTGTAIGRRQGLSLAAVKKSERAQSARIRVMFGRAVLLPSKADSLAGAAPPPPPMPQLAQPPLAQPPLAQPPPMRQRSGLGPSPPRAGSEGRGRGAPRGARQLSAGQTAGADRPEQRVLVTTCVPRLLYLALCT